MLLAPSAAQQVRARRPASFHASILLAVVLAAMVVSCGGGDPSKPIQSLQSAAESARLTLRERRDGVVPERYAVGALDAVGSSLDATRRSIATAKLDAGLRRRALDAADTLETTLDHARRNPSARHSASARLDTLARSLDSLARAAGAKGG